MRIHGCARNIPNSRVRISVILENVDISNVYMFILDSGGRWGNEDAPLLRSVIISFIIIIYARLVRCAYCDNTHTSETT